MSTSTSLPEDLNELIRALNKKRNNTTDPLVQQQIQAVLMPLMKTRDEVVSAQLAASTPRYNEAAAAAQSAAAELTVAMNDLKKIAAAVESAAKVVGIVEAVLKKLPKP